MPRKTKEQDKLDEIKKEKKTTTKTKKTTIAKKEPVKSLKSTKTDSSKKKNNNSKKTDSKSISTKTTEKKSTTKNKKTTRKTTTRKTSSKTSKVKQKNTISIVEYYDLPYRYNQTIVKILAQTPTTLFIYWDISDEDKNQFKKQYGNDFFETTKPILIIYNDTLNYNFEVEINDFANSWYLNVNDSNCNYRVELIRRPINNNYNTNYIHITDSNKIESPNDSILFDKNQKMIYFKDVKTNKVTSKDISNLSFIRNMGKIYNIYDLYKKIYKDENLNKSFNLLNPSSHTSSNLK